MINDESVELSFTLICCWIRLFKPNYLRIYLPSSPILPTIVSDFTYRRLKFTYHCLPIYKLSSRVYLPLSWIAYHQFWIYLQLFRILHATMY